MTQGVHLRQMFAEPASYPTPYSITRAILRYAQGPRHERYLLCRSRGAAFLDRYTMICKPSQTDAA
jgi:hypothetical protein